MDKRVAAGDVMIKPTRNSQMPNTYWYLLFANTVKWGVVTIIGMYLFGVI